MNDIKIEPIKIGTFGNCKICNALEPVATLKIPWRYLEERELTICTACATEITTGLKDILINRLLGIE